MKRVPVPGDRRAMTLRLTQAGQEEFARQARAHEDWIDQMLTGVSADEARAMATRLAAFAESVDEKEQAHAQ